MSVKPPHFTLALTDGARALGDAAVLRLAAPLLRKMPGARSNHSVMVIPGFLGDDRGNGPLIRYLRRLGYNASGWRQGRNLGPNSFTEDSLRAALEPLIEAGSGKVSLVGHSLGGIYATFRAGHGKARDNAGQSLWSGARTGVSRQPALQQAQPRTEPAR